MATQRAVWTGGTVVVWRSLTWGEFNQITVLNEPPAVKALKVYELCKISGPEPETIPAGAMMWIGTRELEHSLFTGKFECISAPLQRAREAVPNNYLLAAQALVATVFKVSFDEISKWDAETFITRVVQAEYLSGKPLDPVNPNTVVTADPKKRVKKPLTLAQQIAVDRKNERTTNR